MLWGGLISCARTIGPALVETRYLHLGEHDTPGRPTRDRSLDTAAIRFARDPLPARLDYEVEAIGQTGSQSVSLVAAAGRQPVRAWFVHGRVGYRLSKAVRLEADAVLLAKGRFLRDAPNAQPGRWTW
ncbi:MULTISPECIES: alginate export family protein [Sphingomonas]|uniref:DsbC/DsbD-like thiol-disulfide interchange protein n=1 Tax=Sphingomonas trueperi TaxID=53317 RepID=A0A7X6BDX6_9SPHN|nr:MULTISPECIES: alginate export family protein [unclassified Sphingomonas]NJB99063.1 DsbC/DsbD-like thiol-disulfide interchange protein [Sphingomonas trueperi]